jgi:hypothetical protein
VTTLGLGIRHVADPILAKFTTNVLNFFLPAPTLKIGFSKPYHSVSTVNQPKILNFIRNNHGNEIFGLILRQPNLSSRLK